MTRTPPATTVIVVAGGDPPVPADLAGLPRDAVVIGADRGVAYAEQLGLPVTLAIGDFDSVPVDVLDRVAAGGAEIRRYPAEKDATDLELALDAAVELNPERVVVLGAHGGRLDHQLANLLLLASPRYKAVRMQARMGGAVMNAIHDTAALTGRPGEVLSLIPVHGPAIGVSTSGLLYPLVGEDLPAGMSRGVSNVFIETTATVSVKSGTLLAVQT